MAQLRQVHDWADAQLTIELTCATREYSNSLGRAYQVESELWAVGLQSPRGWMRRQLCTAAGDLTAVTQQLLRRKRAVESTGGPSRASGLPPQLPLLLPSHLSGLLLHELIGHGLEQGDISGGARVLPTAVSVLARSPCDRLCDDDGQVTGTTALVKDGFVAGPRRSKHQSGATLPHKGHAWVGWHGMEPVSRYPDLSLSLNNKEPGLLPQRYLRAVDIAEARYGAARAILCIPALDLVDGDSALVRYVGARIVVDNTVLPQLTFLSQLDEPMVGACVKNGDVLASRCEAPALVVPHASIAWLQS